MRRIRELAPALLVAIFWIAQVQGTVHAAAHLNGATGMSDGASVPHSVLCIECAAFAQAGAAPIAVPPSLPAAAMRGGVPDTIAAVAFAAAPTTGYRSRAPPSSPS